MLGAGADLVPLDALLLAGRWDGTGLPSPALPPPATAIPSAPESP